MIDVDRQWVMIEDWELVFITLEVSFWRFLPAADEGFARVW
jgi:hypothetical protein